MPDLFKAFLLPACATIVTSTAAFAHPDTAAFEQTAFIETPKTVDCTLENGTKTQCHQTNVGYLPEGLGIGPFCPATLDDAGDLPVSAMVHLPHAQDVLKEDASYAAGVDADRWQSYLDRSFRHPT